MDQKPQIVLTTCPDKQTAQHIATRLVEQRLAACVNIIPAIESVYRWQGKIETGSECLLMIKTRASCYSKLESAIQTLHPYELPELLAVTIDAGLPTYLDWLNDNTQ